MIPGILSLKEENGAERSFESGIRVFIIQSVNVLRKKQNTIMEKQKMTPSLMNQCHRLLGFVCQRNNFHSVNTSLKRNEIGGIIHSLVIPHKKLSCFLEHTNLICFLGYVE